MDTYLDPSLEPRYRGFHWILLASRIGFVAVGAAYLYFGFEGRAEDPRLNAFLLLVVSFIPIWFPVQAGSLVGDTYRGFQVTNPSPPLVIMVLGWLLLLFPLWGRTLAKWLLGM